MMTKIKVGDPVPVVLQIVKLESGLYPQAEIRDDAANLLTTLDMTHEASGLYVATTYNMPDEEFIKITYIVYTDAGHTTESGSYLRDVDVFVKDESLTDKTGFSLSAAGVDGILDEVVENGLTLRHILRLLSAYAFGKVSGGGTNTVSFRDIADTKARIVATTTAVGNRTNVILTED